MGLTRGYWKSTESPSETSVVVSEASKDVASVTTQVTWNKDVVGKQPVPDEKDGVDDGLIRPWPARKRLAEGLMATFMTIILTFL